MTQGDSDSPYNIHRNNELSYDFTPLCTKSPRTRQIAVTFDLIHGDATIRVKASHLCGDCTKQISTEDEQGEHQCEHLAHSRTFAEELDKIAEHAADAVGLFLTKKTLLDKNLEKGSTAMDTADCSGDDAEEPNIIAKAIQKAKADLSKEKGKRRADAEGLSSHKGKYAKLQKHMQLRVDPSNTDLQDGSSSSGQSHPFPFFHHHDRSNQVGYEGEDDHTLPSKGRPFLQPVFSPLNDPSPIIFNPNDLIAPPQSSARQSALKPSTSSPFFSSQAYYSSSQQSSPPLTPHDIKRLELQDFMSQYWPLIEYWNKKCFACFADGDKDFKEHCTDNCQKTRHRNIYNGYNPEYVNFRNVWLHMVPGTCYSCATFGNQTEMCHNASRSGKCPWQGSGKRLLYWMFRSPKCKSIRRKMMIPDNTNAFEFAKFMAAPTDREFQGTPVPNLVDALILLKEILLPPGY